MKKTQIIEMLKNFRKNFVTFISIVLFVSFGMAAYLGLEWSRESLEDSFGSYFREGNLQEIEFACITGIDDEGMAFLDTVPGLDEKEGRYEAYRFMTVNGQKKQIHVFSVTDRINRITFLEGEMPENGTEILIEKAFAESCELKIGDIVDFNPEDGEALMMKGSRFTVSGIVKTAEYTSIYPDTYGVNPLTGCAVQGIMYLDRMAFNTAILPGYSSVLIRCGELENESLFTDLYNQRMNELTDRIRNTLEQHFSEKTISLTPKSANPSYVSAKTLIDVFGRLRLPLAGLFVIVGILVCFFSVTRNVYDQSKLIGTRKALGFYRREILISFLAFSLLSSLLGITAGAVFARFAVEGVLDPVIQADYPFSRILYVFNMKDVLWFGLLETLLILLATLLASEKTLKKSAYSLLTGADDHVFSRKFYMKTRLFQGLSAYGKTIVNNLFSEPWRVMSTVVGVMGITALIACSLSLNDFIQRSFDKQMNEVSKYDTVLYVEQDEESTMAIEACLTSEGMSHSSVMSTYVTIAAPDGQRITTSIYVVDDETAFLDLFCLHDGKNRYDHINGLCSSVSYRNEFGNNPGETMSLIDAFGQVHETEIAGFFDYFLIQNQLVIDKATYEEKLGGTFAVNTVLLKRGTTALSTLEEELAGMDGFIHAEDFAKTARVSFDSFAAVFTLVVGVYIMLAVLMAFIVIMNLLDMMISEKKYELIVLMINGFRSGRVKAYICADTAILTLFGTILGLALGIVMGNLSLDAYNTASICFDGGISVPATLTAVGLTVFLVLIVTVINVRKIDRFKLRDINE